MDDANCFRNFLTNVLQMTVPRHRNTLLQFVSTFNQLLATTDNEIDTFVSTTHSANSGRANNAKILIEPNVIIGLKSILFELKDRQMCRALSNLATLNAIDVNQINGLRQDRAQALEQIKRAKENALNDGMKVPTFKSENYDEFMTAFSNLVSRKYGANDILLDYLLRDNETPANYNNAYPS